MMNSEMESKGPSQEKTSGSPLDRSPSIWTLLYRDAHSGILLLLCVLVVVMGVIWCGVDGFRENSKFLPWLALPIAVLVAASFVRAIARHAFFTRASRVRGFSIYETSYSSSSSDKIHVSYEVNGKMYEVTKGVAFWHRVVPGKREVTVLYDPQDPKRYDILELYIEER